MTRRLLLPTSNPLLKISSVLKVHMINARGTFVGLDDTEAGFKNIAPDLSSYCFGSQTTSGRCGKAHGVPTTVLPEDWTSMMTAFRSKFGKHIPDEKLPAPSYYEAFADKLAIGALKAEPLSMVVSAFEEELQERNKPDPIRHYGISLYAKLIMTTKKRLVSTENQSTRRRYAISMPS